MLDILAGAVSAAETSSAWTMFDSTATVVGFIAAVLSGLGWLVTWYRLRGMTKAQGQLEQMQGTLLLNYNTALEENKRLEVERDEWIPRKWLEAADKEVASGNDAKAIDLLDAGYRLVREDLGLVAHRLAEYHASRMIGFDANKELESAQYFSHLARILAPSMRDIADLADDLDGVEIFDGEPLGLASSRLDAANSVEAASVVKAALAVNRELHEQGRYRPCVLLCRRAVKLATRHGQGGSELGLAALSDLSQALYFSGKIDEADKIVNELRMIKRDDDHPDVLTERSREAQVRMGQGRYSEALTIIRELLPLETQVRGPDHPKVLTTRAIEASLLSRLERHEEAITRIRQLRADQESLNGAEHIETLKTRSAEVAALTSAGYYKEAILLIKKLRPAYENKRGANHPQSLIIGHYEIKSLLGLKKFKEALSVAEYLLESSIKIQGNEHPHTLTVIFHKCIALLELGRNKEALHLVNELLPLHEKVKGASHPDSIATRHLKSHIESRLM